MTLQKRLVSRNPKKQVQEIVEFLSQYGLDPNSLLYRVFDSDKTNIVIFTGTDRTENLKKEQKGSDYRMPNQSKSDKKLYEEMGASSWDEMLGYDKILHEMGLTRREGLWCCRLEGLIKNLDSNHDVVVPEKVGVAIYDPSKLIEIGVEFYAFKEPNKKLDALVTVVSDRGV